MQYYWFILFFSVVFPFFLHAKEDTQTLVKEIYLDTDNRTHARLQAINEISRTLVKEMTGEDKYNKEKQKIEDSIIKKQNRYILSTSTSSPVLQESGEFLFQVTIRVSKANLKNLLLEHNLFYDSQDSLCVFPFISFQSDVSKTLKNYSWWLGGSNTGQTFLRKLAALFFDRLSEKLISTGFYVIDPVFQNLGGALSLNTADKPNSPKNLIALARFYTHAALTRKAGPEDFISLAEFYSCNLILSGYIKVLDALQESESLINWPSVFNKKDKIQQKTELEFSDNSYFIYFYFQILNRKTGRVLVKLKKMFPFPEVAFYPKPDQSLHKTLPERKANTKFAKDTSQKHKNPPEEKTNTNPPDDNSSFVLQLKETPASFGSVLKSLAYQLRFYKKAGFLDLYQLVISVQGPISYPEKEQLKKLLLEKIPDLHSLEERLLTSSRVVYMAQSSKDMEFIANQLKTTIFSNFAIQVKGWTKQELEIYAKKNY